MTTATPAAMPDAIELVVVGAHLSGMPLNHELLSLGASLVAVTRTAPVYRLFEVPGTSPMKPGLLRVTASGDSIEVEVWTMTPAAFGTFVSRIPSPLGIGTLLLEGGGSAKGFLVEPAALEGAKDVTAHGGWRAYVRSLRETAPA